MNPETTTTAAPPAACTPQTPPTPEPSSLLPYTPETPNTPSVVNAGGFQTPQLLSKKALALAGNRVPVGHPSTRPPRPPPPVSPPPTFSKRHSVRLNKPAQKATTLSVVECAAYDLFDSRVMRVVNGWKSQYVDSEPAKTPSPGARGTPNSIGSMDTITPKSGVDDSSQNARAQIWGGASTRSLRLLQRPLRLQMLIPCTPLLGTRCGAAGGISGTLLGTKR